MKKNEPFDEFLKNYRSDSANKHIGKVLYHYTTIESFIRIVESQEIYFTDFRYLNDPTEFVYSRDIIIKTIKDICNSKYSKYNNAINGAIKMFNEYTDGSYHRGVFSLTNKKDNLLQWRLYGDDGNGICFGISLPKWYIRNLRKVIYQKKKQCEDICKWVNALFKHVESNSCCNYDIMKCLYLLCTYMQPYLKHSDFEHECEYRYSHSPFNDSLYFRLRNNGITPYSKVKLAGEGFKIPLREVILGAKQKSNHKTRTAINWLLDKNGYSKLKVTASKQVKFADFGD